MEWYEIIISILSGLAATIPLAIQLVKWIGKAIEEKNWHNLVNLVMNLMAEAECMFDNGKDRKAWVLEMIEASAKTINYPVDIEAVSKLINDLCELSKQVNPPKVEE